MEILITKYDSTLLSLYSKQVKIKKYDYLEAHSHNSALIRRDTSIFRRYSHLIPERGNILDWGCNHAPTACLVKMMRGDQVKLHGCDIHEEQYGAFFDFAGLEYEQLKHHCLLPYPDNYFDAVIGTAALEHVPNDSKSLEELYRIIRPGGVFIMTTLPNKYSYTEWINRRLHRPHHLRRYSLKQIKNTFLHHGFLPIISGYHQVFPSLGSSGGIFDSKFFNGLANAVASQNDIGEKIWPTRCFASNIFVVGRKVESINNGDFSAIQ